MSTPGEHITQAQEARPERTVTFKLYFHAHEGEVKSRTDEIRYVIESGLATEDDPCVRKYTYVEAIEVETDVVTPLTDIGTIATVAKLRQIAQDADAKKAEFKNAGDDMSAAHYAGMRDGLLRAVSVVEGRG